MWWFWFFKNLAFHSLLSSNLNQNMHLISLWSSNWHFNTDNLFQFHGVKYFSLTCPATTATVMKMVFSSIKATDILNQPNTYLGFWDSLGDFLLPSPPGDLGSRSGPNCLTSDLIWLTRRETLLDTQQSYSGWSNYEIELVTKLPPIIAIHIVLIE